MTFAADAWIKDKTVSEVKEKKKQNEDRESERDGGKREEEVHIHTQTYTRTNFFKCTNPKCAKNSLIHTFPNCKIDN